MSLNNFPPEVQEKIKQLQTLQSSLQSIRSQLDYQNQKISEKKNTLKELENVSDDILLYKSVGQIMFRSNATTVKTELSDDLEVLELKLNSLKKQETKMSKQLNELNSYLNEIVTSQPNMRQQ